LEKRLGNRRMHVRSAAHGEFVSSRPGARSLWSRPAPIVLDARTREGAIALLERLSEPWSDDAYDASGLGIRGRRGLLDLRRGL
jgi:hypothetical protein